MGKNSGTELRSRQAARIIGVNVGTVNRWIKDGRLPARKSGTGTTSYYLIDKAEVDRLARDRAAELAAQSVAIQVAAS